MMAHLNLTNSGNLCIYCRRISKTRHVCDDCKKTICEECYTSLRLKNEFTTMKIGRSIRKLCNFCLRKHIDKNSFQCSCGNSIFQLVTELGMLRRFCVACSKVENLRPMFKWEYSSTNKKCLKCYNHTFIHLWNADGSIFKCVRCVHINQYGVHKNEIKPKKKVETSFTKKLPSKKKRRKAK